MQFQEFFQEDPDPDTVICQDQSFANMFFYILYGFSILYLIYDKCRDWKQDKLERRKQEESDLMENGGRDR